jgi:hypothetical protein
MYLIIVTMMKWRWRGHRERENGRYLGTSIIAQISRETKFQFTLPAADNLQLGRKGAAVGDESETVMFHFIPSHFLPSTISELL